MKKALYTFSILSLTACRGNQAVIERSLAHLQPQQASAFSFDQLGWLLFFLILLTIVLHHFYNSLLKRFQKKLRQQAQTSSQARRSKSRRRRPARPATRPPYGNPPPALPRSARLDQPDPPYLSGPAPPVSRDRQ
jgi:hypothetical protein